MLKSEILAIILLVAIVYTTAHNYEEARTYNRNPECAPSNLDRGIKCSAVGPTITVQGGLVRILFIYYPIIRISLLHNVASLAPV